MISLRSKFPLVLLLFTLILCLIGQKAVALRVSNIVYIGDSLTDQGNCPIPFFGFIPPLTNGNTYAFHLGNKFGLNITASDFGGTDFACIGASTGFTNTESTNLGIKVDGLEQTQQVLNSGTLNPNTLLIYWLGADDILLSDNVSGLFPYPGFNAVASVENVAKSLTALYHGGARRMVVFNLPAIERTPEAQKENAVEFFRVSSRAFNRELINRLNNIGFEVIQFDAFSVINQVLNNPGAYGFNNITGTCQDAGATPNCAGFFFFNDVHPTDKAHQLLADFLFAFLTAPDFAASLAEVPFGMMHAQYANIWQQLYPQQQAYTGKRVRPFVSGNYTPQQQTALTYDRTRYDSRSGNVVAGLIAEINPHWTVGAAVGFTDGETDYDLLGSGFDTRATSILLFTGFLYDRVFVNGVVDYAELRFRNIARRFITGPVLNQADGDTNGRQYGVGLVGGYNLINRENFKTGPIANFSYQRVKVDRYIERNAAASNLEFDRQENHSLVGGIGWQATFIKPFRENIDIITNINASANKEFHGGERDIPFRQVSLGFANFASLPVFAPRAVYGNVGANIAAAFKNGIVASFGYNISFGENNLRYQTFVAGVSVPLQ